METTMLVITVIRHNRENSQNKVSFVTKKGDKILLAINAILL
jgi:hypothetical protein